MGSPRARASDVTKRLADLSNSDIVVIAAFEAGATGVHADTEDIAVKANAIGPGRFTWKKYPQQINIDTVRKRLWDARNRGHVVGSERGGWMLTETGVAFARLYKKKGSSKRTIRLSLNERKWRGMEKARLLTTTAHLKFKAGESSAITKREAQGFFRIDAYVEQSAVGDKVLRILNAFADDRDVGPTTKYLANVVREANIVEDHLRQESR